MDARALRARVCVPWIAACLLLLIYGGLTFLNDPRGTLGSDTGIKVATLQVMSERSTLRPGIGYWAAEWDPTAKVHSFRDTALIGHEYVDVPSLPMVIASYPLWRLGGYRLALFWPMVGLLACAFIARGLARRLGPDDGWPAFWLVGLTAPMVLYALDLWEHTLGVAAMGAAVLLLFDLIEQPRWWRGLAAGALFGVAFTMRTEALVYTAVSFLLVAFVLGRRRQWRELVVAGASGVAGFLAVSAVNIGLELLIVGQPIRSARAAGAVGLVGSDLSLRIRETIITLFSPFPTFDGYYVALGVVGGLALVALAWWGRSAATRRPAICAAAIAGFVILNRLTLNPGFWPGLLATTPLAAVGLALGWTDDRRRFVLLFAVLPLPLVFLFQFPGGALPQWGGRYLLTTGFLLMVLGAASLGVLESWVRTGFVGLSVLVTVVAIAWMSTRTHQVAAAGELLRQRPEAVLISPEGFVAREFAATYGDKDWLSTNGLSEVGPAVDVVRLSARPTFAIVTFAGDPALPDFAGFHRTSVTKVPFIDPLELTVTSYAVDA